MSCEHGTFNNSRIHCLVCEHKELKKKIKDRNDIIYRQDKELMKLTGQVEQLKKEVKELTNEKDNCF